MNKTSIQEVFEMKEGHSDEWFLCWLEINKLTILEKEKQQIQEAFGDGQAMNVMGRLKNPEDYYNEKYKPKQ